MDGSFSVGSFFRKKSNEAQQKVKFGQLGTQMIEVVTDLDDMKEASSLGDRFVPGSSLDSCVEAVV